MENGPPHTRPARPWSPTARCSSWKWTATRSLPCSEKPNGITWRSDETSYVRELLSNEDTLHLDLLVPGAPAGSRAPHPPAPATARAVRRRPPGAERTLGRARGYARAGRYICGQRAVPGPGAPRRQPGRAHTSAGPRRPG